MSAPRLLLTFGDDGTISSVPVVDTLEEAVELERRFRRLVMMLVENPTAIGRVAGNLRTISPATRRAS